MAMAQKAIKKKTGMEALVGGARVGRV